MKIEPFRQRARVTEKYVPGAGATPSCRIVASACAALVAPAPAHETSRKYLPRIPTDLRRIRTRSIADPVRIWKLSSLYRQKLLVRSRGA